MARLASCLRYWIADKLNTEPGWKNACYNDFYYYVFEFLFKILDSNNLFTFIVKSHIV